MLAPNPPVRRTWDIVEKKYDARGRLWKQRQPFRYGELVPVPDQHWSEFSYDALGRVKQVLAPDGSVTQAFYNEAKCSAAGPAFIAFTVRTIDAWGRERCTYTNALGHLVAVIEPNPGGNGSVSSPSPHVTTYLYNMRGQVLRTEQSVKTIMAPRQVRVFRYDSLGRLTHQLLPEKLATLNALGAYIPNWPGPRWTDVFAYDERSNLTMHADARGIKTIYDYAKDPLNRLQSVTYDTNGFGDTANPIAPAATVTYTYMDGAGDKTRLSSVQTGDGITEGYDYDTEGRLSLKTRNLRKGSPLSGQPKYPVAVEYRYDVLDRLKEVESPAQYGRAGAPRKRLFYNYNDKELGLLHEVGVDKELYASDITYTAAGGIKSLIVGDAEGPPEHRLSEDYSYDEATGLLSGQWVKRGEIPLLDLTYDYLRAGTEKGRTGQLTGADYVDVMGEREYRDRGYEYDALGRLVKVWGGNVTEEPRWTQVYRYDAFGNRTSVTASGIAADGSRIPRDGLADLSYDQQMNRITTSGFAYDAAGNLTRARQADGTWQRYQRLSGNRPWQKA